MFKEKTDQIIEQLKKIRIVPVLVLETLDQGMRMCEALAKNGLPAAEITFRTEAAESIIRKASAEFPGLLVGAGTVLSVENLERAFDAGAKFAVAPGFNPVVVERAVKQGWPFMPGVSSPSEIEQAMNLGIRHFKFFPAEALGGVKYLNSIIAPYKHLGVSFMPTGGLNPANARDYLAIPQVSACGGTWLGNSSDIKAAAWDKIKDLIKEAAALSA